jgi:isoquinoline 1-oxidoreductase beta subunit
MRYRVPNRRCEYVNVSAAIPRGAWRSVSNTFTAFAVESFIDELAAAAGKDPYQYRRDLIDMSVEPDPNEPFSFDPARLRGVLDLAAQKAGWGEEPPAGHGRGIACHYSFHTYAAEVIEASVEDGAVKIRRVVAAVDCGTVVNPDSGASQVQGGIIDGLSVAFHQAGGTGQLRRLPAAAPRRSACVHRGAFRPRRGAADRAWRAGPAPRRAGSGQCALRRHRQACA